MHCGFVDSRLRRFPPDRASAVPYGQAMDNAMRCPPLAHRSAAAHKLHSARFDPYKIRESQNHLSGSGFSLFHPGDCPSYRDHRKTSTCAPSPFIPVITSPLPPAPEPRELRLDITLDNGTQADLRGLSRDDVLAILPVLADLPCSTSTRR